MIDLRAAAQMAIDLMLRDRNVLYECHSVGGGGVPIDDPACAALMEYDDAIAALRAALDSPEPVAWINYCAATGRETIDRACHSELASTPLYEGPPQRKPLTEEKMRECAQAMNAEPLAEGWPELVKFARAIERAHGIGGEA